LARPAATRLRRARHHGLHESGTDARDAEARVRRPLRERKPGPGARPSIATPALLGVR